MDNICTWLREPRFYAANVSRDLSLSAYMRARKLIGRWDHMITCCESSTIPGSNDA